MLQSLNQIHWYTLKPTTTIIHMNKWMYQGAQWFRRRMFSNLLEIKNMVETSHADFTDVLVYFRVFIKNNAKVSDLIIRSNKIITNFDGITDNLGELDRRSINGELSFRIIQFQLMSNHPICNGRDKGLHETECSNLYNTKLICRCKLWINWVSLAQAAWHILYLHASPVELHAWLELHWNIYHLVRQTVTFFYNPIKSLKDWIKGFHLKF